MAKIGGCVCKGIAHEARRQVDSRALRLEGNEIESWIGRAP